MEKKLLGSETMGMYLVASAMSPSKKKKIIERERQTEKEDVMMLWTYTTLETGMFQLRKWCCNSLAGGDSKTQQREKRFCSV